MKRLALSVSLILILFVILILTHKSSAPTVAPSNDEPCQSNTYACIKITESSGTSYKLNDFRFLPNHCIAFISIPDDIHRQTCGDYKLDWIGPDGQSNSKEDLRAHSQVE